MKHFLWQKKKVRTVPSGSLASCRPRSEPPTSDEYARLVLSMNPAVYYRMEEWPKGKDEDTYVLVDSAPGGHHGILHQDRSFGPRGQAGLVAGSICMVRGSANTPSSRTIRRPTPVNSLFPPGSGPRRCRPTAFIWCRLSKIAATSRSLGPRAAGQFVLGVDRYQVLMAGVRYRDDRGVCIAEGYSRDNKIHPFPRNQWQHVAFVADGAMLRLYRNGAEVAAAPCRGAARQTPYKYLGIGTWLDESGGRSNCPAYWDGRIDEVAIFNHPLTAEQVRQLSISAASPNAVTPVTARHVTKNQGPPTREKGEEPDN